MSDSPYLYHVTYAVALPDIEETGLRSAAGPGIGGAGYDKLQGVFFTEPEGVSFWYSKAEQWAEHRSDDLLEDELVPLVIRADTDDLEILYEDTEGTRDAGGATAWVTENVEPEAIEVWDGEEWVPLEDFGEVGLEEAFKEDEYEGDTWSVLLDDFENPFYPPDEAYE